MGNGGILDVTGISEGKHAESLHLCSWPKMINVTKLRNDISIIRSELRGVHTLLDEFASDSLAKISMMSASVWLVSSMLFGRLKNKPA